MNNAVSHRKSRAATTVARKSSVMSETIPDFAEIRRLMEMQSRMMDKSSVISRESIFDGIPEGASTYYFYTMPAKKD